MAFEDVVQFVENKLATDTAMVLNGWADWTADLGLYLGKNNYLNERTVQGIMYAALFDWLVAKGEFVRSILLCECTYPGYTDVPDLVLIYRNDNNSLSNVFIELKTTFNAKQVLLDIAKLGVMDVALSEQKIKDFGMTKGYVFYTIAEGEEWKPEPEFKNIFPIPIKIKRPV